MVRGQWDQGMTLAAFPVTEVDRRLLQTPKSRTVSLIEPTSDAESSDTGPIPAVSTTWEACKCREQLCQKSALDWAKFQQEDLMSRTVIEYLRKRVTVLTKEQEHDVQTRIDLPEFRRLLKTWNTDGIIGRKLTVGLNKKRLCQCKGTRIRDNLSDTWGKNP